MSDFDTAQLPVRSAELGSLSTRISDGDIPSRQLSVDANGKINVKAFGIVREYPPDIVTGRLTHAV